MAVAAAEERATEREEVWWWRFWEARALGLNEEAARAFAESDADLGYARQLRQAGCPPELLERIVL